MPSRKKPSGDFLDGTETDTLANYGSHSELLGSGASDSGSRVKTVSEGPSLGIFRRGRQYDELRDDASSRSPEFQRSPFVRASGSFSDGEAEMEGPRSRVQAQREGSGSLADGLFNRLTMKEKKQQLLQRHSDDARNASNARQRGMVLKSGSFSKTKGAAAKNSGAATGNGSKAGAPLKQPGARAKRSRMQTTDSHYEGNTGFQELRDDEGDFNQSSPERSGADEGKLHANSLYPATPGRTPENATPIARSSPSLMSTAAKLAASLHQGSRRAVTRRRSGELFSLMDDSASEPDAGRESPGNSGRDYADVGPSVMPRQNLQGWESCRNPNRFPESASPGAMRPLLDSADTYEEALPRVAQRSRSPDRLAHVQPGVLNRPPLPKTPAPSPATASWHAGSQSSARGRERARSEPLLNLHGTTPRRSASSSEGRESTPDGVDAEAAFDIFEPRPASAEQVSPASSKPTKATPPSLTELTSMNGRDALRTLQRGSNLRKKWVNNTSATAASQAPKTERLIRCRIEGSKVMLHYHHQGVKGLYDKEEVMTHVQRVEVLDGPWVKGDCILLHTGRGVLALEAPDAATHATWMLGLNAALSTTQTRGKEMLLEAPVRAIPRNSMFVVTPPQS